MIKRLKIKFVCINMLIVITMLTAIFTLVLNFTRLNLQTQSRQMIQTIHESDFHKGPVQEIRVPYAMVVENRQGILTVSRNELPDRVPEETILDMTREVLQNGEKEGFLESHSLRYSLMTSPFGVRIVFMDASWERALVRDLFRICSVICILALGLFLVISQFLAKWAIKPVETAWQQQKQFVSDASHELKTPLTVIMTNAELLQDDHYDESVRSQSAMNILAMSRQMRGLVEGLLALARVDNGAVKNNFTTVNLSELISNGILPFEPVYFEKHLELRSRVEPGIRVLGSGDHLQRVLDILLDNGTKYAQPSHPVTVCLERETAHCLLSVSSAGEEISKEDLKNIFRRFYRIDPARSMNHSYGLGLSIAEAIVNEHDGKIWAESKNRINTFYVQLPLLP